MIGETERDGLQLVTALHDVVQPGGACPCFRGSTSMGASVSRTTPSSRAAPGSTSWCCPTTALALVVGEVPGIGLAAARHGGPDARRHPSRATP